MTFIRLVGSGNVCTSGQPGTYPSRIIRFHNQKYCSFLLNAHMTNSTFNYSWQILYATYDSLQLTPVLQLQSQLLLPISCRFWGLSRPLWLISIHPNRTFPHYLQISLENRYLACRNITGFPKNHSTYKLFTHFDTFSMLIPNTGQEIEKFWNFWKW